MSGLDCIGVFLATNTAIACFFALNSFGSERRYYFFSMVLFNQFFIVFRNRGILCFTTKFGIEMERRIFPLFNSNLNKSLT